MSNYIIWNNDDDFEQISRDFCDKNIFFQFSSMIAYENDFFVGYDLCEEELKDLEDYCFVYDD